MADPGGEGGGRLSGARTSWRSAIEGESRTAIAKSRLLPASDAGLFFGLACLRGVACALRFLLSV